MRNSFVYSFTVMFESLLHTTDGVQDIMINYVAHIFHSTERAPEPGCQHLNLGATTGKTGNLELFP